MTNPRQRAGDVLIARNAESDLAAVTQPTHVYHQPDRLDAGIVSYAGAPPPTERTHFFIEAAAFVLMLLSLVVLCCGLYLVQRHFAPVNTHPNRITCQGGNCRVIIEGK